MKHVSTYSRILIYPKLTTMYSKKWKECHMISDKTRKVLFEKVHKRKHLTGSPGIRGVTSWNMIGGECLESRD